MDADQRKLARHALGLASSRGSGLKQSYRNRYAAAPGSLEDWAWRQMIAAGEAFGSGGIALCHYGLTRAGALAALDVGEWLDPEDFPGTSDATSPSGEDASARKETRDEP